MPNPYHYGSPVTGDQFVGRHEELRALTERMRDGMNAVIVSPRRYGKTSLLNRAVGEVEAGGAAVVAVTAMGVADMAAFATQLLARVYRVKGGRWHRAKQNVPEFLKRVRVSPTVTFDGDRPTFGLMPTMTTTDLDTVLADTFALLSEFRDQRPAVLAVDEFQDVLGIGRHLPALFKALADQHPHVSLVLAGSKRHVMEQLVLDRAAPLYGMTTPLALPPLPADVMAGFLVQRAKDGGKTLPATLADEIVALAGPVPNDIQYLAYEVYGAAGARITRAEVDIGMRLAVEHEADFNAWRFESLAQGQRRVLAQLASSPAQQPYGDAFRRAVQLRSPGAVGNALEALERLGLVSFVDGAYRVTSPFFAAWLRARP